MIATAPQHQIGDGRNTSETEHNGTWARHEWLKKDIRDRVSAIVVPFMSPGGENVGKGFHVIVAHDHRGRLKFSAERDDGKFKEEYPPEFIVHAHDIGAPDSGKNREVRENLEKAARENRLGEIWSLLNDAGFIGGKKNPF